MLLLLLALQVHHPCLRPRCQELSAKHDTACLHPTSSQARANREVLFVIFLMAIPVLDSFICIWSVTLRQDTLLTIEHGDPDDRTSSHMDWSSSRTNCLRKRSRSASTCHRSSTLLQGPIWTMAVTTICGVAHGEKLHLYVASQASMYSCIALPVTTHPCRYRRLLFLSLDKSRPV